MFTVFKITKVDSLKRLLLVDGHEILSGNLQKDEVSNSDIGFSPELFSICHPLDLFYYVVSNLASNRSISNETVLLHASNKLTQIFCNIGGDTQFHTKHENVNRESYFGNFTSKLNSAGS